MKIVGIVKLDNRAYSNLAADTVRLYGGEDGYAGFVEVFHQLHCLNRIRKLFYHPTRNEYNESEGLFRIHTGVFPSSYPDDPGKHF